MVKLGIKKGDLVEIIAGDDKGKKAKVKSVLPKKNAVIVEGCKVVKKAIKPSDSNPKGGFTNKEMPINISNVKLAEAE